MSSPPRRLSAPEEARGRARGYDARWDRASRDFLARHPVCRCCGGRATVTDHIVPHKGDRALFWNERNWQPACAGCHGRVKQALERRWAVGRATDADLALDSPAARAIAAGRRQR